MTLDAMHWVWKHSQSKGNPRLALLAVADAVRTPACEVRLSYADFSEALNASRSVSKEAVRKALESGELELVEAGKGTRSSLYRLPKAAGYLRPTRASGPESGPLDTSTPTPSGPESGPLGEHLDHASGPESGPEWAGIRPSSGPESGPHSPYPSPSQQEGPETPVATDSRYPNEVLDLVHTMTASGLSVRWPWEGASWFQVIAIIRHSGIDAMVDHALRAAANARSPVTSAKYFLPGWKELPPKPPEGTQPRRTTSHLRAVGSYQSPEERGIF